jgi:hypothetical protein
MATEHEKAASKDTDHLNSFLRGELSAVETYRQVMEMADKGPEGASVRTQLQPAYDSHERRVRLLTEKIRALGGKPSTDSGAWGSFAKAVQGGAKAFGLKAAVAVLEQGEDHGRNDYQRDIPDLSPALRDFVKNTLLAEQLRTHDTVSRLKKTT